jgi:hypothetical protein
MSSTLTYRVMAARIEDLYEERAAIMEFDAGFTHIDAEVRARIEYPAFDAQGERGTV